MLSLILAQSAPPAGFSSFIENVAWTVITLAAVAVGIRQIIGKPAQVGPQPFTIKAHESPVTQAELKKVDDALHGRLKRERGEIDAHIQRVENAAERRSENLEQKIDENTKFTAALGGEVKQINQSVVQLTTAINNSLRDAANKK